MSAASDDRRVIVVLGAMGRQGGGVVRALLRSQSWIVLAGTRDPASSKATKFLTQEQTDDARLRLVEANVYDIDTLRTAFTGAYGVFAITSETHPDKKIVDESELKHEIEAGRNIVHAAKDSNVQHFVFSSLPDMMRVTSGRFPKLYHMNNKHAIEMIAREELQERVTSLIPGFFYSNLEWRQYSRREADGVVRFCYPIPSDQVAQWTDPEVDMGVFAARVFDLGVKQTGGKSFTVLSSSITPEEMAETFTKVTGQRAYHSPSSFDEFGDLAAHAVGPAFKEDAMQMMQWASVTPKDTIAFGSMDPSDDDSMEQLGVKASSFEEWLQRSGWTGPK